MRECSEETFTLWLDSEKWLAIKLLTAAFSLGTEPNESPLKEACGDELAASTENVCSCVLCVCASVQFHVARAFLQFRFVVVRKPGF